ncbi:hypothetical protein GOODEAATRI_026032 [Goodea atripinnis]|uniref:Uncharacterized protein n=1 Tax=Goodea atripinnis TaxID=208336 RepID=A0ABV0Q172_9TELE
MCHHWRNCFPPTMIEDKHETSKHYGLYNLGVLIWSYLTEYLLTCQRIFYTLINSFTFYTAYSRAGQGGAGTYLQQSTSERQGTPWAGRQSIARQHRDIQDKQPCRHPFTPKGNL